MYNIFPTHASLDLLICIYDTLIVRNQRLLAFTANFSQSGKNNKSRSHFQYGKLPLTIFDIQALGVDH